jgi:PIN domain nuclease of toxin-antitoxin system
MVWGRRVRLLLDTHILFWWVTEPARLSTPARSAITDRHADVVVSVASLWEMAIKVGNGKWPEAAPLVKDFEQVMASEHFRVLPITLDHVRLAGLLAAPHRDPFDRLLAAQAQIDGLMLVTADPKLQGLGAACLV